jgi:hypothetical protein
MDAVVPDHEPELERPEAAAERHVPVAVVEHRPRLGRLVLEELRQDAQRTDEHGPVGHEKGVAVEVGEHPLVRVEAVAVGRFEAVVDRAQLRAERRGAGHGGVDVQPEVLGAADAADLGQRVDGPGRGRADRGGHEERLAAGGPVAADRLGQRLRAHGEPLVDFDRSQIPAAETGDADRLLGRRMRLAGGVGDQPAVRALLVDAEFAGPFARGEQGAEHGARGRVLDDAAALPRREEALRQPEHPAEPVEDVGLQLRAGRAGRPEHPLNAEPR